MLGKVKMVVTDLNVSEEFLTLVERLSSRGIVVELIISENSHSQPEAESSIIEISKEVTVPEPTFNSKPEKKKTSKAENHSNNSSEDEFFGML